jgi:site-specific DNA-cytosine methylase
MKNITWAAVQPLTGGMYYGAEKAIGHPAEFIVSFPGLEGIYKNRRDEIVNMGNERHMLVHLKKNKRLPEYFQFEKGMFDYDVNEIDNPSFITNEFTSKSFDPKLYSNSSLQDMKLDLVVAVPVCSGLSAANTADHGKDDSIKNNNLRFLANWVLKKVQPKVYIFENAPGLITHKGRLVRNDLNTLAVQAGYAVTYVKTNTYLHDNVQKRPRTFVIFWKGTSRPPDIGFENLSGGTVVDFLSRIPQGSTQNDSEWLLNKLEDNPEYQFLYKKFGNDWRKEVGRQRIKSFIISQKLCDDFYKFHKDEKLKAHYDYCMSKIAIGKGYYDRSFFVCADDHMPTIYHGSSWSTVHPVENRCFTFRELMYAMGMPNDFEYLHDEHSFGTIIGQNVPARTAQFWVSEIVKVLEDDWDAKRQSSGISQSFQVYLHNNEHPKDSYYMYGDEPKMKFGQQRA